MNQIKKALKEVAKTCKCKKCRAIRAKAKSKVSRSAAVKAAKTYKSIYEWEKIQKIWQNIHPVRYKIQQIYCAIYRFFYMLLKFNKGEN